MKWNKNNVTTESGNKRKLFAKFDTSDCLFETERPVVTGTQIATFRKVAKLLNASTVELKYADDVVEPQEKIITVYNDPDGVIGFWDMSVPKICYMKDMLK